MQDRVWIGIINGCRNVYIQQKHIGGIFFQRWSKFFAVLNSNNYFHPGTIAKTEAIPIHNALVVLQNRHTDLIRHINPLSPTFQGYQKNHPITSTFENTVQMPTK